ncbi:unnamed protein product [Rotaria sp. Silwood1]|nr:unnamed protein product [Rotaria sp. Silwood1]
MFALLPILISLSLSLSPTQSAGVDSLAPNQLPIGTIALFGGDVIPPHWLLCDGSAVSRMTYFPLFLVIGTLYGTGDHVRTFNVPDFRGRFPLGLDGSIGQRSGMRQGGASQITLTQGQLPPHSHARGSLAISISGNHTHSYDDPGHDHGGKTGISALSSGPYGFSNRNGGANDFGQHSHTIARDFSKITIREAGAHSHAIVGATASEGQGMMINIMNPYQTINYIIYAGPEFTQTIG